MSARLPNLLEKALGVLPNVVFHYRHFTGFTVNEMRVRVPEYAEGWQVCRGMVQPVAQTDYKDMGLDFAKRYVTAWGSIPLKTLTDQEMPDQIKYLGHIYNITTLTRWRPYNKWNTVVAVEDKREAEDGAL